jgi:hypothetical protein
MAISNGLFARRLSELGKDERASNQWVVAVCGALHDALTIDRVNRRSSGVESLTPSREQHYADDDSDDASRHENVTDKMQVDPGDLEIQRERKDRADDKEDNSGTETHDHPFLLRDRRRDRRRSRYFFGYKPKRIKSTACSRAKQSVDKS